MRSIILIIALVLRMIHSCGMAESASLEEQVIKLCESRYSMIYVRELFAVDKDSPEALKTYERAKKLPIEAIPICFTILADQKNQDNRRAGAIGLFSLLSQKPGVSTETKARMREVVLQTLAEKRPSDKFLVPVLAMEFLYRWGKNEDIAAVIPFLDRPEYALHLAAESTYRSMMWRAKPDAPVEKMMEEAKAQYRAQQAALPPEPPPPSIPEPEAAPPSPPAPVAVASLETREPLPVAAITVAFIALLAATFLVHCLRQNRRG